MEVKDLIKDTVQIGQVAEDLGNEINSRSASALKGICPKHGSPTTGKSFVIFPQSNNFKCFGCSVAGDVISLVEQVKDLGFRDALIWLTERYRPDLMPELEKYKGERSPEEQAYYQRAGLLEAVFEYGKERLFSRQGQEPLRYLTEDRG